MHRENRYSFSAVCINAWIWSTIFHTRDLWFTEMMDYFSAFLIILSKLMLFFVRSLWQRHALLALTLTSASLAYFAYHCYYLSSVSFDYGYNMKVNIIVGLANSICWIFWSSYMYFRHGLKYMWRCGFAFVVFNLLITFEIFDFSPIWWILDSHALWHFSTFIIPILWFQFMIDDVAYIQQQISYDKLS